MRLDGTKALIALTEGLRESTESWADLLRDCRGRGMRDPELVVGDDAMGLWKALAVRAGARFKNGHLVERPGTAAAWSASISL